MSAPYDLDHPLPAVRPLEVQQTEQDGEQRYLISDPGGFLGGQALVSPMMLFVMSLLDGRRTLRGLQEEIARQSGQPVTERQLQDLVQQLDDAYFLDSPAFHTERDRQQQAFRAAAVRPATLAGVSYPGEAEALRADVESYFAHDRGPGPLLHPDTPARQVRGILAPHLDFPRGKTGYAHAYHALAQGGPPELVIILAVAHTSPASPYIATPKDFATPYGTVATDRDALDRLQRAVPFDLTVDEYTHRTEHSAEFQAVWLRHCFPPEVAPNLRILPILCSSFQGYVEAQLSPGEDERVQAMVAGLTQVVAESGEAVRIIGGVDLSHMGPRYGDSVPIGPDQRAGTERFDRKALASALTGDGEAWFGTVAATGDRSKICGLSAIYTFNSVLTGVPGELLQYGQVDDPTTPSIVSYCAAVFG
jgi:AmmeMemoRadiSam system protein B